MLDHATNREGADDEARQPRGIPQLDGDLHVHDRLLTRLEQSQQRKNQQDLVSMLVCNVTVNVVGHDRGGSWCDYVAKIRQNVPRPFITQTRKLPDV